MFSSQTDLSVGFQRMASAKRADNRSLPFPIVSEGNGWLVVDKPAGMTVHNHPGADVCSLVSSALASEPSLQDSVVSVNPVHRLDKETSGILLLATTAEAFRFLARQFESGKVRKQYTAILHGNLADPLKADPWGVWKWPLAKAAGGRRHPQGSGKRHSAETRYRILDRSRRYALVEIDLRTGRKHQIRRHAKLAGHGVVGDARYGSKRAAAYLRTERAFDRLALHSYGMTIGFPESGKPETITTTKIPEEMRVLFRKDQIDQRVARGAAK